MIFQNFSNNAAKPTFGGQLNCRQVLYHWMRIIWAKDRPHKDIALKSFISLPTYTVRSRDRSRSATNFSMNFSYFQHLGTRSHLALPRELTTLFVSVESITVGTFNFLSVLNAKPSARENATVSTPSSVTHTRLSVSTPSQSMTRDQPLQI